MAIRFETNVPQEFHLRFLEGKETKSQFGGVDHLYSAEEGAFYVSAAAGQNIADQLRKLNVRTGEPVTITKREVSHGNGRKGIQWQVERVGEQPDGTFIVPAVPNPPAAAAPAAIDRPRTKLEDALKTAVAAVHAAQEYARAIGFDEMPVFSGEDIRCMVNTILINDAGGKRNAA